MIGLITAEGAHPPARTIGSTFDFTFKLPKPHISGNSTKKNRRNTFEKNDRATP